MNRFSVSLLNTGPDWLIELGSTRTGASTGLVKRKISKPIKPGKTKLKVETGTYRSQDFRTGSAQSFFKNDFKIIFVVLIYIQTMIKLVSWAGPSTALSSSLFLKTLLSVLGKVSMMHLHKASVMMVITELSIMQWHYIEKVKY